ncbi:hypothetical protein JW948_09550 [bacterium]|nr:hypothetical protein [bacterium]
MIFRLMLRQRFNRFFYRRGPFKNPAAVLFALLGIVVYFGAGFIRDMFRIFERQIVTNPHVFQALFFWGGYGMIAAGFYLGVHHTSPSRLRSRGFLPVSRFRLFLYEFIITALDIPSLVFFGLIIIIVTAVPGFLNLMRWPGLILICFLYMTSILSLRFLFYLLYESLLGRHPGMGRLGRLFKWILAAAVLALTGFYFSFGSPLPLQVLRSGRLLIGLTPWTSAASATGSLFASGLSAGFIRSVLWLTLTDIILMTLCFLFFSGLIDSDRYRAGGNPVSRSSSPLLKNWLHDFIVPQNTGINILLKKEILYLIRSGRTWMYLLLCMLVTVIYCSWLLRDGPTVMKMAVAVCIAPVVLSKEGFYMHTFDGKGIQQVFIVPVRIRHYLLIKNLAYFCVVQISLIQSIALSILLFHQHAGAGMILLCELILIYFYAIISLCINSLLTKNPSRTDFCSIFGKSTSVQNNILLIIAFVGFSLPVALVLSLIQSPAGSIPVMLIMAILAVDIYAVSLRPVAHLLEKEKETFVMTIRGG